VSNDNGRNEDSTVLFIYNVLSVKITVLNVASVPLLSIVTLQQRQWDNCSIVIIQYNSKEIQGTQVSAHYSYCQVSNDNGRNGDSTVFLIYNVLSVKITVLNVASFPLLSIVNLQQRQWYNYSIIIIQYNSKEIQGTQVFSSFELLSSVKWQR